MIRFISLFLIFSGLAIIESQAQYEQTFFDEADALFSNYVSEGKVNYKAIHQNPELLNSVLDKAKTIRVSVTEEKKYQAFWINAYNISVIKGIIDNFPLKSPLDKEGFFDKITYELGGDRLTLNDIENKKLRAKFSDPRFHFVLVCGARGCPPLLSKAYKTSNVQSMMEKQTTIALNNNYFIKVSNDKVAISEIFKWYKVDFVKNGSTEIDYINRYRESKIPATFQVSYYPYDWRLNTN